MPAQKPSNRFYWTQGQPGQVATPDDTLRNSGWSAGQPIAAQHINDLFYELGSWVQWLDENQGATVLAATLDSSIRLIGGGTLGYTASNTTLSWSAPLVLSVPSVDDADNTIAPGGISVPAGYVAYVNANIPFSTTADVTSGSTAVKNLAYDQPIAVGQSVTGPGIPAGTTVAATAGTGLTLSMAATATGAQVALTFCGTQALSVQTAPVASFIPNANSIVLARGLGSHIFVGVNAAVAALHDGESRTLLEPGYLGILRVQAGQALTSGQFVYISTNLSGSRTPGAAYPTDCSQANGATRALCAGMVYAAAAQGAMCSIVTGGTVPVPGGWAPGTALYLDPATPGGITASQPPIATTPFCVRVGFALTATSICLRPEHVGDGIFPSVKALTVAASTALSGPVQAADGTAAAPGLGFGSNTATGFWHSNTGTAAQERLVALLGATPLVLLTTVGTIIQAPPGGAPALFNDSTGTLLGTINPAGVVNFPSFVSGAGFKSDIMMGEYYTTNYPGGTQACQKTVITAPGASPQLLQVSVPMSYAGSVVSLAYTCVPTILQSITIYVYKNNTQLTSITFGSGQSVRTRPFPKGTLSFAVQDTLQAYVGTTGTGQSFCVSVYFTIERDA